MDAQRRKRVLGVEDSSAVAGLLRELFRRAGCDVEIAHDGQSAWAVLESRHIDAVVTDQLMPKMNGDQLLRRMRNDPRFAHLPAVMLTARAHELDKRSFACDLRVTIFAKPCSLHPVIDALCGEPEQASVR